MKDKCVIVKKFIPKILDVYFINDIPILSCYTGVGPSFIKKPVIISDRGGHVKLCTPYFTWTLA